MMYNIFSPYVGEREKIYSKNFWRIAGKLAPVQRIFYSCKIDVKSSILYF